VGGLRQNSHKVTLHVAVPGKTIVAEVKAKSLRRTVAAIAIAGPNGVAVILQGKLQAANTLTEAGIAAQPKARKPPRVNAAEANADELTDRDPRWLSDLKEDEPSTRIKGEPPLGTGHVLSC
jgi:hypothetical protein